MVTDKVTKEVKDMVGEYNEWLRDKVVQSKFFLNPKKQGGEGGLRESHFHFLLFLTWETPQKKVLKCKIHHNFF